MRLLKKLSALRHRWRLHRDLEDELRFHLEMKAQETGDPIEARRRFGNPSGLKDACRDLWSFTALESWWQDFQYALRTLAKTPGFTAVAIAALGLGIGADTAIYSIVHSALTWDMGLDHPDRIVYVGATDSSRRDEFGASYPDFQDFRRRVKSLAGVAAYQFVPVNLSEKGALPERYFCAQMSANGNVVAEQSTVLGRDFVDADEQPGAAPVVILGYHVWESRYGKDTGVVGKTIRINEVPTTVIGIMASGKRNPEYTDLWTPLVPDARLERRDNRNLMLFGRLAQDYGLSTARTELDTIATGLAREYPNTNRNLTANVQPIFELTGAYTMKPVFLALFAAVGFVLLIACADVANMLLARGAARSREISIRIAIGAGRTRIVRQLLVESCVLALAGGTVGWLVAVGGVRWFHSGLGGLVKPVWLKLSLDPHAFAYLTAISIGTGIAFGLAPALRLARTDINSAVRDGGRGASGGRRGRYLSNALVTFEMALCAVLLAASGLMIRSAFKLYGTPIGIDVSNVLTMLVNLPEAKYPRAIDEGAFHYALQKKLASLPGVEEAAVASSLPYSRPLTMLDYEAEDAKREQDRVSRTTAVVASAGYFRVLRLHPLRGRVFLDSDFAGEPTVVVNERFAETAWPGVDPIGKRIRLIQDRAPQRWLTVVGVAPDVLGNFRHPLERDAMIYLPYAEATERVVFLIARTAVPPASLADAFRREVQRMDDNLPVYEVRTLEDRIAENRLTVRLFGAMLSIFAAIALVLAGIGLYAVTAHGVSQRTQEIGIRMALGGGEREILRLVFGQGLRPLLLGLAIGLTLAFAATRVLGSVLAGVSPGDPVTFLGALFVLILAGVLGCAVPAWRAVRVDPVIALRCD